MTLEVGIPVRVKRMGGSQSAIVVRDYGDTVRVRFVATGKERTIGRERLVGGRAGPVLPKLERPARKPTPREPTRARFKAPSGDDPKYLEHVRTRPCCICGAPAPSDPHHFGPRIRYKADDRRTVPLCRKHHDEWHATGCCEPYTRAETQREFYRAQVDALLAYDPGVC